MGLTRAERETVIRWDEESKVVSIWSSSPVIWSKLARLGIPATTQDGAATGEFYTLLLQGFRWGLKRRPGPDTGPRGFARLNRAAHGVSRGQDAGDARPAEVS
jgi:hypothetical protein